MSPFFSSTFFVARETNQVAKLCSLFRSPYCQPKEDQYKGSNLPSFHCPFFPFFRSSFFSSFYSHGEGSSYVDMASTQVGATWVDDGV